MKFVKIFLVIFFCTVFNRILVNIATIPFKKLGIPHENIACVGECTCCTQNGSGGFEYGSFHRETATSTVLSGIFIKLRYYSHPVAVY